LSILYNERVRILRRGRTNTYADGKCDTNSHTNFNSATYADSQRYADTEAQAYSVSAPESVME